MRNVAIPRKKRDAAGPPATIRTTAQAQGTLPFKMGSSCACFVSPVARGASIFAIVWRIRDTIGYRFHED